ncbi:MAG: hypothetical protein JNK35_07690 [Phycisphaerae bacterium]|nr:hypothetical protein [Phycisphaerae bacterium]
MAARLGHLDTEIAQDALGGLDRADKVRRGEETHAGRDGGFEVAHQALRVGKRDPGAEVVEAEVVTFSDGVKRLTRVGEVGEDLGGLRWREGEHVRLRGRDRGRVGTRRAGYRYGGAGGRDCARAGVRRGRVRQRIGTAAAGVEGEFENPVGGR